MSERRAIPRVWEVDWALPPAEASEPWSAYAWLLDTAEDLGLSDVTILGSTFDQLGRLGWAIGSAEASRLRVQPHGYVIDGITVHGASRRGSWSNRGPVLVAWADDKALADVEGRRPPAIAAVATWPDDVSAWRAAWSPRRVGQVRSEQEARFSDDAPVLGQRAQATLRAAAGLVNSNHSVLSTTERERVVGALLALHDEGVAVELVGLQAWLMAEGWNGRLIAQVVSLADRVARGQRPKHTPFSVR